MERGTIILTYQVYGQVKRAQRSKEIERLEG